MIKLKPRGAKVEQVGQLIGCTEAPITKTTMAAMRLAIARKPACVTKLVTKPIAAVTKPNKGGRPPIHASHAERQKAYRSRKKAANG